MLTSSVPIEKPRLMRMSCSTLSLLTTFCDYAGTHMLSQFHAYRRVCMFLLKQRLSVCILKSAEPCTMKKVQLRSARYSDISLAQTPAAKTLNVAEAAREASDTKYPGSASTEARSNSGNNDSEVLQSLPRRRRCSDADTWPSSSSHKRTRTPSTPASNDPEDEDEDESWGTWKCYKASPKVNLAETPNIAHLSQRLAKILGLSLEQTPTTAASS